jgi:uncharacterized DUF497 family protein
MKINVRYYAILLMLISIQGFSQQTKTFKVRHQGYVNGDMALIANNIVNRADYNDNALVPYNERTVKNKINDECNMKYIDIDNDESTFSSSSADLVVDNKSSKKIIYAGLYWSATYLYESGKMTKSKKFKAINDKREAFDKVKIKLPNQEEYSDIKGELIYDGIEDKDFKESAPYVMFADITEMVINSKNPFGTYTVANIKSTTGMISGGVSGGWSIFFIYEDLKMTGKYITTYDGFAGITDKSLDINFSGFQTLPEGKVNAKIACVALEGDLRLKGDQVLFKTSENKDFTQLSNNLRDKTNFFNSSITNENDFFQNRVPNSLNTLGYDSFVMTIDNLNNSVVGNNTHDATVRLKTFGDRFFMFFNAFNVEVVAPKNIKKEEIPAIVDSDYLNLEKNLDKEVFHKANANKKVVSKKAKNKKELNPSVTIANNAIEPKAQIREQQINSEKTKVAFKDLKSKENTPNVSVANKTKSDKVNERQAITSESEINGYYIIANVFAKHSNAIRFIASLKEKGINAKYFINPVNNYRYVYIIKEENLEAASNLHNSKINGQYNGDLWIMTVNKQEDSALVSNDN